MSFTDGCDLPVGDLLRLGHASLVGQIAPWVIHQAINPLNAGQGITQQLLEEYASATVLDVASVCEDLRLIETQGQRLYTIFGDLRDFSRPIEIAPPLAPLDLAAVVRLAASFLAPLATRREAPISVELSSDEDGLQIEGARMHLVALFARLLHNALARTCDGRVLVTLQATSNGVRVEITDSGSGPAAHRIERLFETLHSANEEVAALGVHMAEAIVSSHGGTMSVDARDGGGEAVTIELPRSSSER